MLGPHAVGWQHGEPLPAQRTYGKGLLSLTKQIDDNARLRVQLGALARNVCH